MKESNNKQYGMGGEQPPRREKTMYTVRWFWVDGTYDEFEVETKRHAEMMAIQLYSNPDIVSVEISDF